MEDQYADLAPALDSPAGDAFTVTPDDVDALSLVTRGIYVGAGGNLAVEMAWGGTVVFANVPAGAMLPLGVRKVLSTGTTGGSIVGVY